MNSTPPDDNFTTRGEGERAPEPETLLDHALALAALGCFVFPLRHDGKLPAHKGWQAEASRDRATLTRWFGSQSKHNIGIYTGRFGDGDEALLVVDIDHKHGVDGEESWFALQEAHGDALLTREHRTASGARRTRAGMAGQPVRRTGAKRAQGQGASSRYQRRHRHRARNGVADRSC